MSIIEHFRNTEYMKDNLIFHHEDYAPEAYNRIKIPNFIYVKLCKTGGTSIYRGVIEPALYDQSNSILDKLLYEMTDNKIKEDYFKFTFVRNPFDRLLSAYIHMELNIARDANTIRDPRWMVGTPWTEGPSSSTSFEDFIKNKIVDDKGMPTNEHWSFQYNGVMTEDGEMFVDYIGRFENLKEDWKYVSKKLNFEEYLPHFKPGQGIMDYNLKVNQESTTGKPLKEKDYRQYYTDELVDIVSDIYIKDLEVFNYEF